MKARNEYSNPKKLMNKLHKKFGFLVISLGFIVSLPSCKYIGLKDPYKVEIPDTRITPEQAHEERYGNKINENRKSEFLHQTKDDGVTFTLFNVIKYNIVDQETNVGEGFDYYILDIGIDNSNHQAFDISRFTSSCHLSNEDSSFSYTNIPNILKMYSLQRDSSEMDIEAVKNFLNDTMPGRDFYRAKLLAYEVSAEDKNPLIFHYTIHGKKYAYPIRDRQY